jgi:uncharacterized protein (DUF488 family)
VELLTVGHGTLLEERFGDLLISAGVQSLVDVRRAPGSRRHPHFSRGAMEDWIPRLGVAYSWAPGLGGWRRPAPESPNVALRNDSFRGYADYMRTTEFWAALDPVLAGAAGRRTAVMCSEAVYWRCHRRLISDAVELVKGLEVRHLEHRGALDRHRLTDGVRAEDGLLIYDGGAPTIRTGEP